MRVKGSIVAGWIKAIRADKATDYSRWLTDEDREVVAGTVFSSSWYPFETYRRCCQAVFHTYAKGDPQVLRDWGAENAEAVIKQTYATHIIAGQPLESLKKHLNAIGLFFDFGSIRVEALSDRKVRVTVEGFPPDFEEIEYLPHGRYGKILEMAGATGLESRVVSRANEGDGVTRIEYCWQSSRHAADTIRRTETLSWLRRGFTG